MAKAVNHWLMKTEPQSYSIHNLAAEPDQSTFWDGVRNYQARNFMRSMKVGDRVLFYHSNANPPAVAGTAVVCREAYPDFTQFDPEQKHYDGASSHDDPRWDMVDIRLESVFAVPVPLDVLRGRKELEGMELLRRGSRLSVQPVSCQHFEAVLAIAARMAADHDVAALADASAEQAETNAVPAAAPRRKSAKQRAAKPTSAKKRTAKKHTAKKLTAKEAPVRKKGTTRQKAAKRGKAQARKKPSGK